MQNNRTPVATHMIRLKTSRDRLTVQQYRTLKGQILSGNAEGAMRGLDKILKRETPVNNAKKENDHE